MKVTLTRQVTDNRMRILTPGEHDLPEAEARFYVQQGWSTETPEPAPEGLGSVVEQSVPAIPDGWEKAHHLQRVRLAKEISGRGDLTIAEADAIIRAELQRRGEGISVQPGPKVEPDPTLAPKRTRRAAKKRRTGDAA